LPHPDYRVIHFFNEVTLDPGPNANVFWADQFTDTIRGGGVQRPDLLPLECRRPIRAHCPYGAEPTLVDR
jgi:hypothetical protein